MLLHNLSNANGTAGSTFLKINCKPIERLSSSQIGTAKAGRPDKLAGVVYCRVLSRNSGRTSTIGTDGLGQIGITRKSYDSKKLLNQSVI